MIFNIIACAVISLVICLSGIWPDLGEVRPSYIIDYSHFIVGLLVFFCIAYTIWDILDWIIKQGKHKGQKGV